MESLQKIQSRLGSVKNINKITKAMEVVAATKMRRSQEIALASRPYAYAALNLLSTLTQLSDTELPALLTERPVKRSAYVLVASDKGLAGAFNSQVSRAFSKFVRENNIDLKDEANTFIAVGQKAVKFLTRETHGVAHTFIRYGDYTTPEEVEPLSKLLIQGYLDNEWDEVYIFSTHFKTALYQEVLVEKVLPVNYEHLKALAKEVVPTKGKFAEFTSSKGLLSGEEPVQTEYLIEPSAEVVLDTLSRHLVEMELYHIILEANASEHAARRTAMKNASDNASDLVDELTVLYNKSRQANVTSQIIEITAAAEAL